MIKTIILRIRLFLKSFRKQRYKIDWDNTPIGSAKFDINVLGSNLGEGIKLDSKDGINTSPSSLFAKYIHTRENK